MTALQNGKSRSFSSTVNGHTEFPTSFSVRNWWAVRQCSAGAAARIETRTKKEHVLNIIPT